MTILADVALPLLLFAPFPMLVGLIAVIVAEVVVARKMLNLSQMKAFAALIVANVVTTIIGFPLVVAFLCTLQFCFGLESVVGEGDFKGQLATLYLFALLFLVPAFFASVYIERWICRRFWRDLDKERIRRFSWIAHYASYSALLVVTLIYVGILHKVSLF